ncbi:MAG: hypothetical protein JWR68_2721 [Polaromonas sp.]|nr:hypothetical protein [Polaromonas sp.]
MYERSIGVHDPAERQQIQNAIAALNKNRTLIGDEFPKHLKKAIDDDAAAGSSVKAPGAGRSLSSVSFDELELMGDNEVQQAVESARLQQLIKLACESGLAVFSARLSTAQGFLVVKADSNPMRPDVMAQALLNLLQALPVTAQARACWLLDGARIMGEELQALYVSLSDFLAGLGMPPAPYGVISTPDAKHGRVLPRERMDAFPMQNSPEPVSSGHAPLSRGGQPAPGGRKQLLTLDHLHHLLMGDYDNSIDESSSFSDFGSEEIVHHEFSHTVPAALDVLTELEEKGLAPSTVKASRPEPPRPVAQLRARLRTGAKTLGQSLAIEVVGLMIEQLVNDERLLMPVRRIIANAEPAFLRLAVTDSRFFSDKGHPARRLLDTITNTSLAYSSESAAGFPEFMQSLEEIAVRLKDEQVSEAEHFTELLHDFERKQNRNTPLQRQTQRRAVQALLQAEQRNLMASKIAAEIRARPDFAEGNRTISAFLTGPWAQVMARERLLGQQSAPGSTGSTYSLTLGDVLWSLDTQKTAKHRHRLLKMIPDMLQSVRDGLASIDFPIAQSQSFFDELMAIHQTALKAVPDQPAAASKSTHKLEKMFVADDASDAEQVWLAPSEVQHSGFMEDWDTPSMPGVRGDPAQPQADAMPAKPASPALASGSEFNLGDWVDLFVDMQWLRAQLTWISPHDTMYMFTSEGGRKHSMTSRVLHHLLKLDMVKIISQKGVVDGALDSVARTAMRNSVHGENQPGA